MISFGFASSLFDPWVFFHRTPYWRQEILIEESFQTVYTNRVLTRFPKQNCNLASTPIESSQRLTPAADGETKANTAV